MIPSTGSGHVRSTGSGHVVERLRTAGCVFAEDEARLIISTAENAEQLDAMVSARVEGLPLEHVLGWVEFDGLRIAVDPQVFVPRQRSVLMVERAQELIKVPAQRSPVIVDLCCGCGALGVALASRLDAAQLHAADIDPVAVECARRNVTPLGGQAYRGDLYDALPQDLMGRVDVLIANAPYVPTTSIPLMPREARLHEPTVALDGGSDGFTVIHRILAGARQWLTPEGCVLVETSEEQAESLLTFVRTCGLKPTVSHAEEIGATVVSAVPHPPR